MAMPRKDKRKRKMIGVRQRGKRWVSEFRVSEELQKAGGRNGLFSVGSFPNQYAAAKAHDTAKVLAKGPNALINFPTDVLTKPLLLGWQMSRQEIKEKAKLAGAPFLHDPWHRSNEELVHLVLNHLPFVPLELKGSPS